VRRGDVLGLVGTSGNSSEPHLHFQVSDGPSALVSNGLPYLLRSFSSRQRGVSTEAFDEAITSGKPITLEAVKGTGLRKRMLPLDLWIVDFVQPSRLTRYSLRSAPSIRASGPLKAKRPFT
jgi:murein DD-endopeptidase MepM/ murein hydrolase activator NlpD